MKNLERKKARELRKEKGLSVNYISKLLNVSKSSVSFWVKDIELTEEQKKELTKKTLSQLKGANKNKILGIERRRKYQEIGRIKAKTEEILFVQGCMLYWGEGAKGRKIDFTNTDPLMIVLFVKFLKKYFNVKNEKIKIFINCYLNNNLTLEEIKNYWLNLLKLDNRSLGKCYTKKGEIQDTGNVKKYPYGTCKIVVYNLEIVQQIFGAIKEYTKDNSDRWIN
ncbi:MAG: helix-turn-helix transcriptional regulator, partial [Clostridia bacterium]